MPTITEDYVSFETAKMLKEKGFDEKCFQYWHEEDKELIHSQSMHPLQNISNPCFFGPSAPTLQMAMKWLREVHNIFISITYENDGVFTANLKAPLKGVDCMIDNKHNCWLTYEQAAEAGIKYCLENLI